jgi:hypothetical protein
MAQNEYKMIITKIFLPKTIATIDGSIGAITTTVQTKDWCGHA